VIKLFSNGEGVYCVILELNLCVFGEVWVVLMVCNGDVYVWFVVGIEVCEVLVHTVGDFICVFEHIGVKDYWFFLIDFLGVIIVSSVL